MAALAPAKTAQRQGAPAQARPIWTEAGAQKVRDSLASEAWEARLAAARAKREKVLAK